MRILLFAHNFPPALDGGARLLSLIAEKEKRKGREVLVLTSDAYSTDDYLNPKTKRLKQSRLSFLNVLRREEIRVIRMWTFRWGRPIIRRVVGPIFLWFPWLAIWRFRPHRIVAGVFPTTVPIYAWFLSRILRAELILVPCFHQKEKSFYRRDLLWVLKQADKILALTDQERRFYQKNFGIPTHKLLLFKPKMGDLPLLGKYQQARFFDPPTILFIGSQAAHKRIEWLIEAFVKLKVKSLKFKVGAKKLKLVIAGPETLYSPNIKARIGRFPKWIRRDIEILGKVSERKKILLLDRAWVLVNPSIHESLGLVFYEAWARKKPVVAADLPVLREVIVDGKDGFLFKKNSIADLIEKISWLVENPQIAKKMGKAGYNKIVRWKK